MKNWFLAMRPKTLPAAIVPVWAGCALVVQLGAKIDWALMWATLFGAIAIQIATNFFNDAIDDAKGADTEKRLGPRRVTASGLISRRAVYAGGVVFLLIALFCGWFLFEARGWAMVAIGVPSFYLSYGYTGGPWPLAYKGLGEIFVILFFGIVAVMGTVFVQMGEWRIEATLLGLQIGLLSAVLIAINNYRDVEEDRLSGKKTLAVRFGKTFAQRQIFGLIFWPYIMILNYFSAHDFDESWLVLALFFSLPMAIIIVRGLKKEENLNRLLAFSALHLILFTAAFQLAVWLD